MILTVFESGTLPERLFDLKLLTSDTPPLCREEIGKEVEPFFESSFEEHGLEEENEDVQPEPPAPAVEVNSPKETNGERPKKKVKLEETAEADPSDMNGKVGGEQKDEKLMTVIEIEDTE